MSRNRTPAYRQHKRSRQAVVTLRTSDGKRRDIYLGPWKSRESRAAYARVIAEYEATGGIGIAPDRPRSAVTVYEVLDAFIRHAATHYRHADGTHTSEFNDYKILIKHHLKDYGPTPAAEFGPIKLKVIREQFVRAGLSRKVINQRIGRVKRIFRWAVAEELVSPSVYQGLAAVTGLQWGRTTAKETAPVVAVGDDVVSATLPHLSRHVAGLVRFQLATGCRPSEACTLRRCDLDTTGPVWLYRPVHHKLAYRGKVRVIAVGPKAQAVLAEFPTDRPDTYVFSARRGMEEIRAAKFEARKTPKWPSHLARNKAKRKKAPKKSPADRYTRGSYTHAVAVAVKRANARRERMAGAGEYEAVPHWHPNQLRHSLATKVRALFGLEAAQVALGHERASTTEIYAERNVGLAVEVAGKIG